LSPRIGLDDVERSKILPLSGLELRPLSRPPLSRSLYRLRYPGSSTKTAKKHNLILSVILLNLRFKSEFNVWVCIPLYTASVI
jgi:hypothetical protein